MKNFRTIGVFLSIILAFNSSAQPQEILDIAQRYNGENAVILRSEEQLIFKFENNKLTAKSNHTHEILLLNDLAPGIFNTSYIFHSQFHHLSSYEAYAYLPTSKSYKKLKANFVKTTKVETENIFFDDNQTTVLAYQGLVKYAKTKLTYTIEHRDLGFLPSFFFQSNTPIIATQFDIVVPKGLSIKTILQYVDASFLSATITESKNNTTYSWTAQNVPRYKDFNNSPSWPVGVPHVIPYVSQYSLPKNDSMVALMQDEKSLYRFIYKFISNTNKTEDEAIKKQALAITKGCADEYCKAEKIYNWVQENIKYVAFEDSLGGFIPREGPLVLGRKYGDCKDMTSLLVSLCRAVGIEAHYTWIGTRSKPYSIHEVPLPIIFNHMIATWQYKGEWLFMDGTHPSIKFGTPPYALQDKEALVSIDAQNFKIVKVPILAAEQNQITDTTWISINDQNEIEGNIKSCYRGYPDWNVKSILKYNNEKDKQKTIKSICSRGSNKFFQKSGSYESDSDKSCFYSNFTISDYVQKIDKEIYLNLNLERYNSAQKIEELEQRKVPFENKYRAIINQVIILNIPKNYTVTYLPKDEVRNEPNLWSYSIKYLKVNNQIICTKVYQENALLMPPSTFVKNNEMVKELNEFYKETIVLKAIE